jgi:hypothetical protein
VADITLIVGDGYEVVILLVLRPSEHNAGRCPKPGVNSLGRSGRSRLVHDVHESSSLTP